MSRQSTRCSSERAWAMEHLITHFVPEQEAYFEDYVDDDGRGNGPFKIALSIRRAGDRVLCDFTGTSPQAEGPINFYLNERMFKMLAGAYMISLYDPEILFNEGYIPLFEVVMPEGSLLQPKRPAALGSRTHTMCRWYDVFAGALSRHSPEFATAAGFSSSPHIIFSGYDQNDEWFTLFEIGAGGIPGRPVGDGMDGHTMWPWFSTIPAEYIETYYPLRIVRRLPFIDSGGAGLHRGGNGVEIVYRFLVETEVAIMDDRWLTRPWGINGGNPAERGERFMVRAGTAEPEPLPSKIGDLVGQEGDELIFRTWGGAAGVIRSSDHSSSSQQMSGAASCPTRRRRRNTASSLIGRRGSSTRRRPRSFAKPSGGARRVVYV